MARFKIHKRIFIVFTIILNIVSLIVNWLLYAGIVNIQPGLVFGPYPDAFEYLVLGLCILSSIINILEVLSLYSELFKKESMCWLDGNTTSAMSIWLDDIPKAGLMVYISACHDMAISVEEIVRACLLMCTIVIRLLALIIRETCVRRQRDSLPTREEIMYRRKSCRGCHFGFICLGLVLKLVAFCFIYFNTYLTVYPGGITYKRPSGLFEPKRDASKFVQNSSIFTGIPVSQKSTKWLELVPITDVIKHKDCTSVLKIKQNSSVTKTNCGSGRVSIPVSGKTVTWEAKTPIEIFFQFKYVEPSKSLLLGNIEYSVKVKGNVGFLDSKKIQMKYFCKNYKIPKELLTKILGISSKENTHVTITSGTERYASVKSCWKTGKLKCKMTGMDGPQKNLSLGK